MASPQQPATMENLPGKLLSNILIRLPAKQLAQMRCVSKPYNALLSQPSFIKSHFDHSVDNNKEILLIFYNGFSFDNKPFTAHPSRSPHIELTNFIKLPFTHPTLGAVIGSVNGLICFSNYKSVDDYAIYIWNPSLSALLTLPSYTLPSRNSGEIDIIFRFGYDPKIDDYKVIMLASISSIEDTRACVVDYWLQVKVYSMRRGSWKLITQRFPSDVTRICDEDEVCVDGHDGRVHWLGYIDEEMNRQTIIAFDLNMETFTEIQFPDPIGDFNVFRVNVFGVLAGKICVISPVMDDDDGKCEVWVMNEYGVAESWVKKHIYSQFSVNMDPIGFTLTNEFLFEPHYSNLALYDPIAAKVLVTVVGPRFGPKRS